MWAILLSCALVFGAMYAADAVFSQSGDVLEVKKDCPRPNGGNVKDTYQGKDLCASCHTFRAKDIFFKPFNIEDRNSGHRKHLRKRDRFTKLNINCWTCHDERGGKDED